MQRHYLANNGPSSQIYGFSSSHAWMWELDYKESWVLKYWCFWTVVLENTLESHLDCKEIKSVHPKGNQLWIFIGRTDAEAETPILWPPDLKNWLTGKDPGCWERLKVGGEGDDRGWDGWMASPTRWTWVWASSRSWWWTWKPGVLQSMGGIESDTTEQLNRTELNWMICAHSFSCIWCVTTWTVDYQAPLSLEFPRQVYYSGLPLPTSGSLPDPGIEPTYPASPALLGGFFTTEPRGKLPACYELPKIRCNWVSPFFVF